MKILYIADGRSPIALNWMRYFVNRGDEIHLVSMYPCQPEIELASLNIIPVAFSRAVEAQPGNREPSLRSRLLKSMVSTGLRTWLRQRFVPRTLPAAADHLKSLVRRLQPDIVHAMRIPYEGMLAALVHKPGGRISPPLLVSVWGNDFTLHAPATRRLSALTRLTLERADALHTDCQRDQRLAFSWGFDPVKPGIVLPGAGGIQLDTFYPGKAEQEPLVINPRGLRAYLRTDTFFKAIPLVLESCPGTKFICPNMAGRAEAEGWVRSLGIERAVTLLPRQTRPAMADLFRQARVVVSPSTHDGTPNTLLEAMACGCVPVAGDLESIREWITPEVNGLLVDPANPQMLAGAICEALQNQSLRDRARGYNRDLIRERAEYQKVMGASAAFYEQLIWKSRVPPAQP